MRPAICLGALALWAIVSAAGTVRAGDMVPKTEPDPPVQACDRLAGDPKDAARVAPGTRVPNIDLDKALPACRAAVATYPNSARLQYHMGRVFHGLEDYGQAVAWFRKAAEQGYAPAMSILGVFYAAGGGVDQDYAEAVRWYRKAAARGYVVAMHNLAIRYTDGRGISQDFREAVRWFRKAAAAGHASSMEGLAYIYMAGKEGVAKDLEEAVHWLRLAAQNDRPDAMYFLGLAYDRGEGIARDPSRAAHWFKNALAKGSRLALQYLLANAGRLGLETRRAFQGILKGDGLFSGTVDGVFGADTLDAVSKLLPVR